MVRISRLQSSDTEYTMEMKLALLKAVVHGFREEKVEKQIRKMSLPLHTTHAGFRVEVPPALGPSDVHLWRIDLETAAVSTEPWLPILSPDEQTRAARFHFDTDRRYFAATRAILRQMLGSYLAIEPKALILKYSQKNKPALGGAEATSDLSFNVSHSGKIALLAFTRLRHIGVDVERVRHDLDTTGIATRFFSIVEQDQLAALPADQRDEAFFRCWTRKEAYIKATGDGLSLPLNQFDVSLAHGEQNALLATRPDQREAKRWTLRDIVVEPGYAAALCVSGSNWRLLDWIGVKQSSVEEFRVDGSSAEGLKDE
jgi:4'-phosphopantetheinyl transferase